MSIADRVCQTHCEFTIYLDADIVTLAHEGKQEMTRASHSLTLLKQLEKRAVEV